MYLSRTGQRNPRIYKGRDTGAHEFIKDGTEEPTDLKRTGHSVTGAHTFIYKKAGAYVFIRGTGARGFIKGGTQKPMDCTKDGTQEPTYFLRTRIHRTYMQTQVGTVCTAKVMSELKEPAEGLFNSNGDVATGVLVHRIGCVKTSIGCIFLDVYTA
jgi:hypothetical protein